MAYKDFTNINKGDWGGAKQTGDITKWLEKNIKLDSILKEYIKQKEIYGDADLWLQDMTAVAKDEAIRIAKRQLDINQKNFREYQKECYEAAAVYAQKKVYESYGEGQEAMVKQLDQQLNSLTQMINNTKSIVNQDKAQLNANTQQIQKEIQNSTDSQTQLLQEVNEFDKAYAEVSKVYQKQAKAAKNIQKKINKASESVDKHARFAQNLYLELNNTFKDSFSGVSGVNKTLNTAGVKGASGFTTYGKGGYTGRMKVIDKSTGLKSYFNMGSLGATVQQIHGLVEEMGGALDAKVNSKTGNITFTITGKNLDTPRTFDIGLANELNTIEKGSQQIANIMEWRSGGQLLTKVEQQGANVLKVLQQAYVDGKTLADLTEGSLAYAAKRPLKSVSNSPNYGLIDNAADEINDMLANYGDTLHNLVGQGTIDLKPRAYKFRLSHGINTTTDADGNNIADYNDSNFLYKFSLLTHAYLTGTQQKLLETSKEDETMLQMFEALKDSNETLESELLGFRRAGLIPRVESEKPQMWGKGLFSIFGAANFAPMTALHPLSDRATIQALRGLTRRNEKIADTRRDYFTRQEALDANIDYKSRAEFEQLIGRRMSYGSFMEAIKDIKDQFAGLDLEDRIIMPQYELNRLASNYRQSKTLALDNPKYDKEYQINSETVVDEAFLQQYETVAKDFGLELGDIVYKLGKVGDEVTMDYAKLLEITSGIRMNTQVGDKVTVTALGVTKEAWEGMFGEGVQFVTEKTGSLDGKTLSASLNGRMRLFNIMNLENQETIAKGFEHFAKVLTAEDETGKALYPMLSSLFDVDTSQERIIERLKYGQKGNYIGYLDKNGNPILSKKGDLINLHNEVEAFGRAILGDKLYESSVDRYANAVIPHDISYYENAYGFGGLSLDAKLARVTDDNKTRAAIFRKLAMSQQDVLTHLTDMGYGDITEVDYQKYIGQTEAQTGGTGPMDKGRYEANQLIGRINDAIQATIVKGASAAQNIITLYTQKILEDEAGEQYIEENGRQIFLKDLESTAILLDQIDTDLLRDDKSKHIIGEGAQNNIEARIQGILKANDFDINNTMLKVSGLGEINRQNSPKGFYLPNIGFGERNINVSDFYLPIGKPRFYNEGTEMDFSDIGQRLNDFVRLTQKGRNTLEDTVDLYNDLNTLATHSNLTKRAEASHSPFSAYSIIQGDTTTIKAGQIGINEEYLRDFLKPTDDIEVPALQRMVKQMAIRYEAATGDKQFNAVARMDDITSLMTAQQDLVDAIIDAWKSGAMSIMARDKRYPLTSDQPVHYSQLVPSNIVGKKAVTVSPGLAQLGVGDFDVDRMALEILGFNPNGLKDNTVTQEVKTYQIEKALVEQQARIERNAENFTALAKGNRRALDKVDDKPFHEWDAKSAEKVDSQIINNVQDWFAGLIGKYNFQYVGQFSNINTRVRKALSEIGWDTANVTSNDYMSQGYSALLNAFFGSIEQDAISAKHVADRLNDETYFVNELDNLFETMTKKGDLREALNIAGNMGLYGEWTGSDKESNGIINKYFLNAMSRISAQNPQFYKYLSDNKFLDQNGIVNQAGMEEALTQFQGLFGALDEHFKLNEYGSRALSSFLKGYTPLASSYRPTTAASSVGKYTSYVGTNDYTEDIDTTIKALQKVREKAKTRDDQTKRETEALAQVKEMVSKEKGYGWIPIDAQVEDFNKATHDRKYRNGLTAYGQNSFSSMVDKLKSAEELELESKQKLFQPQGPTASTISGDLMHKINELALSYKVSNYDELRQTLREVAIKGSEVEKQQAELAKGELEDLIGMLDKNHISDAITGANTILRNLIEEKNIYSNDTFFATEVDLAGRFKGDSVIHGAASDLIRFEKATQTIDGKTFDTFKMTVSDYKKSTDFTPQTLARRFLQTAAYEEGVIESLMREMAIYQSNPDMISSLSLMNKFFADQNGKISNDVVDRLNNFLQYSFSNENYSFDEILQYNTKNGNLINYQRHNTTPALNVLQALNAGTMSDNAKLDYIAELTENFNKRIISGPESSAEQEYLKAFEKRAKAEEEVDKAQAQMALLTNKSTATVEETTVAQKELAAAMKKRDNAVKEVQSASNMLMADETGALILSPEGVNKITEYQAQINLSKEKQAARVDKAQREQANSEYGKLINQWNRLDQQTGQVGLDLMKAQGRKLPDTSLETRISRESELEAIAARRNNLATQRANIEAQIQALEDQGLITEEQRLKFQQMRTNNAFALRASEAQITTALQSQAGLLSKMLGSFKEQMGWIINRSLVYGAIGKIKQAFSILVNTTQQLDAALINIQIATGDTREEVSTLLSEYQQMAYQLGKTTQEFANASNSWLRAGYRGAEAAELTKASLMLSTLGMIESSQATTYLISTLKGWKLAAEDVIGVVDKLSAIDMNAAISAGDLALAMSRANNSARLAGADMNKFIGYVTTVADVSQKSAESVGESFKTIFSRFGNVKAGKYAATTLDESSGDYNSDDFEALNDIEKVLSKVNVKVRETATTWRDIDDILSEIGEKWEGWDQTTKNAVATAIAGTRQRENVLTLFENWSNVAKFEEIAANSYGTAVEKMNDYTVGVEAAKNRFTSAIEKWTLGFSQGSNILSNFYNALSFVIENLFTFSAVLTGLLVLTNMERISNLFVNGLTRMAYAMYDFDNKFQFPTMESLRNGFSVGGIKEGLGKQFGALNNKLEQRDIFFREQALGETLDSYRGKIQENQQVLTEDTIIQAKLIQNRMLHADAETQGLLQKVLNNEIDVKAAETKLNNIIATEANSEAIESETITTAQAVIAEENSVNIKQQRTVEEAQALIAEQLGISEQEQLNLARHYLTAENYDLILTTTDSTQYMRLLSNALKNAATDMNTLGSMAEQVSTNLKSFNQNTVPALQKTLSGAGSMAGRLIGGMQGYELGNNLGLSGAGQTLAMFGGSIVGGKALSGIGSGVGILAAGGGKAAALAAAGAGGGLFAFAGLIAMVAYNAYKKYKAKILQEAQEAFKESKERYDEIKGIAQIATDYDKLANGVNKFGQNLSLSDSEYEQFIEYSNRLADVFPELVERVDENGNAILKMGNAADIASGKIKNMSDTVKDSLKDAQNISDASLVQDDVFEDALKNAQKDYKDTLKKYQDKQLELSSDEYTVEWGSSVGATPQQMTEIRASVKRETYQLRSYEKQLNQASAAMNDYILAEARLGGYFDNLTNAESSFLTNALKGLSMFDNKGKALSLEQYRSSIYELAQQITELLHNSPATMKIAMELDNATTAAEISKGRAELLKALINEFGSDNVYSEDELKVMVALGFEYDKDTNTFTDAKDYISNIKRELEESGASDVSVNNAIERWGVNAMAEDQAANLYQLISGGWITANTDRQTVSNLMLSDLSSGASPEEAIGYAAQLINLGPTLQTRIDEYYDYIKKGGANTTEAIGKNFSDLPEHMRNVILSGGDDIVHAMEIEADNLNEVVDNSAAKIYDSYSNALLSSKMAIASSFARRAFSGVETGNDQIIGEWSELSDMLDVITDSYKKLKDAKQEQVKLDRLTWATALDLLQTNAEYVHALEVVDGKIRLKSDAEKIMAEIEVAAAKANIEAKIADLEATNAQIEAELEQYDTTGILVESTNASIDANNYLIESLNLVSDGYATAAAWAKYYGKVIADPMGNYAAPDKVEANHVETYKNVVQYEGDAAARLADARRDTLNTNKETIELLKQFSVDWDTLADSGYSMATYGKLFNDELSGDGITTLEKIKDLLGALNKEFAQMITLGKGIKDVMGTFNEMNNVYYSLKKKLLDEGYKLTEAELKKLGISTSNPNQTVESIKGIGDKDTFDKAMSYYQDFMDYYVQMQNIDDERIQDQLDMLTIMGDTTAEQVQLYKEKIATADTLEETLRYEKEYVDALEQQLQTQKEIAEYSKTITDYTMQYTKGNTSSKLYKDAFNTAEKSLEKSVEIAHNIVNNVYTEMYKYYMQLGIYTDAQAKEYASNSSKYRDAMKNYIEAQQAIGNFYMDDFNNRINNIENQIKVLEMKKPKEWASTWNANSTTVITNGIKKIKEYYSNLNNSYESIASATYGTLNKYAGKLTDEQVQQLVEKYNDALKNIRDNNISQLEDIKSYQESIYNAINNEVGRYTSQLEKQKEIISDMYDLELKKLNDKNTSIERTNRLIELQNNLLKAQEEKERVYVAGIGWTYQTNRTKVKAAQKDLDAFYREDKVSDLTKVKEEELKAIDDRIKNWSNYLAMLKSKYEEYDRLQEQRLLRETLHIEYQEDLERLLMSDMLDFTEYMSTHTESFLNDQIVAYDNYNTSFGEFLNDYKLNLEELAKLTTQALDGLMDISDFEKKNDKYIDQSSELLENTKGVVTQKKQQTAIPINYLPSVTQLGPTQTNLDDAQKKANNATAAYKKAKADYDALMKSGTTKRQNSLTEHEFNSSEGMKAKYGTYQNYLKGVDKYGMSSSGLMEGEFNRSDAMKSKYGSWENYLQGVTKEQEKTAKQRMEEAKKAMNAANSNLEDIRVEFNNNQQMANSLSKQNLATNTNIANFMNYLITSLPVQLTEESSAALLQSIQNAGLFVNTIDENGRVVGDHLNTNCGLLTLDADANAESIMSNLDENGQGIVGQLTSMGSTEEAALKSILKAILALQKEEKKVVTSHAFVNGSGETIYYGEDENGYSGSVSGINPLDGIDDDLYIVSSSAGQELLTDFNSDKWGDDGTFTGDDGSVWTQNSDGTVSVTQTFEDGSTKEFTAALGDRLYSRGILGGPVTYTGLAMLHGSPNNPEYVLNNEQAYNLLRNLATKQPEYSRFDANSGDSWILNGDIILENCDDPAQFWNEVTQAMSNRFNVTKNRNTLKK